MSKTVLVFIEHIDGQVSRSSYEAVRAAQLISQELGFEASAVICGSGVSGIAAEVATRKLAAVYTAEDPALANYTADGYAQALRQVVNQLNPELVLMAHTYEVRDYAPKLAANLGRALLGDCIGYKLEGGELIFTRQIFQGKLACDVVPATAAPNFASFQIGEDGRGVHGDHISGHGISWQDLGSGQFAWRLEEEGELTGYIAASDARKDGHAAGF